MTTAAEFYGDPEILDELAVLYGGEMASCIVPTVMGMLVARETSVSDEKMQRIFHDDLRLAVISILRWMGNPANQDRFLDQILCEGTTRSRRIFPAVEAFMDGRFDQFFQEIIAEFNMSESG